MAISQFEVQIMNWVFEIMNNGTYQKNERTGIGTNRISHMVLGIDCDITCPLIKAKKTLWKSSVEEAFWIFRDGSNDIHDLRPHIWDEWADENGIVQKTYGYQIKKYDQVNRILNDLTRDPSTRRAVIDLWNNADLPEMAITPCVYTSVWDIVDGKLNVLVTSRSCDLLLGGLFNIFQYTILNKLFARHLGVKPGLLTFVAADAHIYENQFEGCKKMLKQYQTLIAVGIVNDIISTPISFGINPKDTERKTLTNEDFIAYVNEQAAITYEENSVDPATLVNNLRFKTVKTVIDEILEKTPNFNFVDVYNCDPKIIINDNGNTNFFNTTIDDINVVDYLSMPMIKLPVAV